MSVFGEIVFKITLDSTHSITINNDVSEFLDCRPLYELTVRPVRPGLLRAFQDSIALAICDKEMPSTTDRVHCFQIIRGMKYTYGNQHRLSHKAGSERNFLVHVKQYLADTPKTAPRRIEVHVTPSNGRIDVPPGWKGYNFDYLGTEPTPPVVWSENKLE